MANTIGWGQAAVNNTIDWGKGKTNNTIGWGTIYSSSPYGDTDLIGTPATDADAQLFITNAVITNATQQNALNNLVISLKGYGLWTKLKAFYPFLGGSAFSHKFNLRNPIDSDSAFRLTFAGGVTHDSNGITGNGVNAFANTFIQNNLVLTENNKHVSMYQRNVLSAVSGTSVGIGNNNRFYLNYAGSNYSAFGTNQSAFAIQTPQQGFFTMTKLASGSFKYYQNALTPITKTGADLLSNLKYNLLANTTDGTNIVDYSSANLALVSIGDGLSDAEYTNYRTAVQTFQTTLGRNV